MLAVDVKEDIASDGSRTPLPTSRVVSLYLCGVILILKMQITRFSAKIEHSGSCTVGRPPSWRFSKLPNLTSARMASLSFLASLPPIQLQAVIMTYFSMAIGFPLHFAT